MFEISPVHRFVDSGINYLFTNNYNLSIRILPDGFSYAIFDIQKEKFLAVEEFLLPAQLRVPGAFGSQDYLLWLDAIINQNYLLKESFNKIYVLVGGATYTLLPTPLFDTSKARMYLAFNHPLGSEEVIGYDMITAPEACLIYAVPGRLSEWAGKNFPAARRFHVCGSLIRSFFLQFRGGSPVTRVLANIQPGIFDIIIFRGSVFQLCNTFHYTTETDLLYYLLFVTEQLKINSEESPLYLSGRIENNSEQGRLLNTYFRFVELIPETNERRFTAVFDGAPLHHYFDLLNVSLCG